MYLFHAVYVHVSRQYTNFMLPLLQEVLGLKEGLGEPDENFGSRG